MIAALRSREPIPGFPENSELGLASAELWCVLDCVGKLSVRAGIALLWSAE